MCNGFIHPSYRLSLLTEGMTLVSSSRAPPTLTEPSPSPDSILRTPTELSRDPLTSSLANPPSPRVARQTYLPPSS